MKIHKDSVNPLDDDPRDNPLAEASKWETKLGKEGYHNVYGWQDKPNTQYGDHQHPYQSTHVILEGEMKCTMNGKVKLVKKGMRIDVPAHTVHSVKVGPKGCVYIIGEKEM